MDKVEEMLVSAPLQHGMYDLVREYR